MFRVPSSVVVRRPISIQGTVVPVGTTLTKEQVVALGKGLNSLLDNGTLVATPDPFARKDRQPKPTSLPPVIRNAMIAKLGPAVKPLTVLAKAVGKSVSVEVDGGVQPFTVSVDDQEQTKKTRTFAFTVTAVGSHTVTVTDGNGNTASDTVVIVVEKSAKKAETDK
jgi:hypothetical protein